MTTSIDRHRVLPSQTPAVRDELSRLATAVAGTKDLQAGDSGPGVKALQQLLAGVNAYSGPISGTFDAATKAAVEKLQSARHLSVNGVANTGELGALAAQQLYITQGFKQHAGLGQKGTDIARVEGDLKGLGFNPGKVDGAFDSQTLAAVRKYRKADKAVPDQGDFIGPTLAAQAQKEVKHVEAELKQLGRDPGRVDGTFTAQTATALEAFQRKHHLAATGTANAKTRAALDAATKSAGAGERFPHVQPGGFQHGYDTSQWQSQATFDSALGKKSTKFMAIKATDGTGYVDPDFKRRWAQLGSKLKPGGLDARIAYHFLEPGNGKAQADHFLNTLGIHGKLKPGTRLALDWEASALSSPQTLKDAANRIHQVTGAWPLIYTSASRVAQAHQTVPGAPIWDAHWSPGSSDYKYPFVQTGGSGVDQDVFTGNERALEKWAGWP
jgi:peptidoglycan hydrolase-like protein with peptidoglycan-binding domain